ncbi:MAG: 30S ribosomal protein S11 [Candidatus Kerfeldbacteria bacterium RIFCSPHIGHO2_02_FULL_42_14]|uniref:Small ribosomal subunit protein uS11 n=1 Tax=Candidatus Kerfeldbacteria bacterium RIFCSPHIGHO2_02_FULL_42_14 TaxID=1798540 RepID=A0A1G2AQ87_9BACT|nr:MAG: 30S ribosomal protein S11 [Candidatus Kerfeldbacteria bacterium RIFCSPHIGHO2_02_FULL_42_14]OGY80705.1 MAG: 30S ribosomal protein S11 [Candidatus Kerfeldbacteria bacterium RIFCSPHIGHO2_12_FULL_42_13]OGY82632.1 MAG: 30S ribosomal protein S11 [Candidatus Kerfeldbacteria bacterium RIFCSPLOWO2_02_FULL_42_19]OGY85235.1 MAG: 30S ribosomal protein S11 [Candidatus Kerfeldbacteria bacterium RIFCSPLOWO2_12_FULL_43_9]
MVVSRSKKKRRVVTRGKVHIHSTYNNTIFTITDLAGNVIAWSSAGKVGFSGPKKSTPYAAGIVVRSTIDKAKEYGLKDVVVEVKGIGTGRDAAIRAVAAQGLNILNIRDVTPIPHNGCKRPKPRRV